MLRLLFGWLRRDDFKLDAILDTLKRMERTLADLDQATTDIETGVGSIVTELGKLADLIRKGGDRQKIADRLEAQAAAIQTALGGVADVDPPGYAFRVSRYSENYRDIVWADLPPDDRPRAKPLQGDVHVLRDIAEFKTQDGAVISSRSHLRAYEEKNGIKQIGNDWPGREKPKFWDGYKEAQSSGRRYRPPTDRE